MAQICVKCGKKIGLFSNDPLILEVGDDNVLCFDCASPVKNLITDLYYAESIGEFNQIKDRIIEISNTKYDKTITIKIEKRISKIRGEVSLVETVMETNKEVNKEVYYDYDIHGENPIFEIKGSRGRRLYVYEHKCVIKVDITVGSLLTNNATDGEKTIYYKDVIGIQLKKNGLLIGYLQLETASEKGNNKSDNFWDENTFTFNDYKEVHEAYRYIISRMDKIKSI